MKFLTIVLLCCSLVAASQVKGDGNIITKDYPLKGLAALEIGIYADIVIDLSMDEQLQITADANLLPLIETVVVDGRLVLSQLEWIQPSKEMVIRIGAPMLKQVTLSTNDEVVVKHLTTEVFSATSLNGRIILNGTAKELNINAENGTVDADAVASQLARLNIWGWGKAIVRTAALEAVHLGSEAQLDLVVPPEKIKGNISRALKNNNADTKDVQYISFKIKNNSYNRKHFFVVGPKPEGGKFSYGFPLMPGGTRKETWTTGTRIYTVNRLGLRKLVRKISLMDKGKTLPLF